MYKAYKPNII